MTLLFVTVQCTEASGRRSSCWPWPPGWWEGCCWSVACPSSAPGPTKSEEDSSSPRVSVGNGIWPGQGRCGRALPRVCGETGEEALLGWWGLWWGLRWLGVNDFPLSLPELNLYAQSSFSKTVLSPREAGALDIFFFFVPTLLRKAEKQSLLFQ